MSRARHAWLITLALAACGGNKEDEARAAASSAADKARAAAATVKEKAAGALDRAKAAAATAKDHLGDAIDVGEQGLDAIAQRTGILEDIDAKLQHAAESAKAAATDAARNAALATVVQLTKARAAIAKRIDELKAAGTYAPRSAAP